MNDNHRDPDDTQFTAAELDAARLTAYALGQLDEQQRAEVEALLARSEQARRTVEETAALAQHITQSNRQTVAAPTSDLREAVERHLNHLNHLNQEELEDSPMKTTKDPLSTKPARKRRFLWATMAVSACLLVVAVGLVLPAIWPAAQVAMVDDQPDASADQDDTRSEAKPAETVSSPVAEQPPTDSSTLETVYDDPIVDPQQGVDSPNAALAAYDAQAETFGKPVYIDLPGGVLLTGPDNAGTIVPSTEGAKPSPDLAIMGVLARRPEVRSQQAIVNELYIVEKSHIPSPAEPPIVYPDAEVWRELTSGRSETYRSMSIDTLNTPIPSNSPQDEALGRFANLDGNGDRLAAASNKPVNIGVGNTLTVDETLGTGGLNISGQLFRPGVGAPAGNPTDESGSNIDGPLLKLLNGNLARHRLTLDTTSNTDVTIGAGRTLNIAEDDGGVFFVPAPGEGEVAGKAIRATQITGGETQSLRMMVTPRITISEEEVRRLGIALTDSSGVDVDYGTSKPTWETKSRDRSLSQFGIDSTASGTEQYDPITENAFFAVTEQPLSTFSVDVDTASYANVRRFLGEGRLPPPNAVRIEELINYFSYDYPAPEDAAAEDPVPFSVNMEVAQCPWNGEHRLVRVGLKGREVDADKRGPSNLVFLLDVSGSMRDANKLDLVKQAMTLLVDQLTEDDRVAIVTYASGTEVRLPSTGGHERQIIRAAIDTLTAGGSTHGSAGIQLAYEQALTHFVEGGTNRVILCTDGDLNVGITEDDALVKLITEKATSGVFLTVLGFGTGNLKDSKMEKLADKGNGIYAYIDGLREARKVLVEQVSGSLITIAKDVKLQIEFNPAEVAAYRLIGYENRTMAAKDFRDDKKDAGEIGAGHTVTALYEVVPAGAEETAATPKPGLKYQKTKPAPDQPLSKAARSGELLTLWLRYKQPDGQQSSELEFTLRDDGHRFSEASADFRFASAVASFGMVLRGSGHAGDATMAAVEEFAAGAIGEDPQGYRTEFVDLVRRARKIRGQ